MCRPQQRQLESCIKGCEAVTKEAFNFHTKLLSFKRTNQEVECTFGKMTRPGNRKKRFSEWRCTVVDGLMH